MKTLRVLERFPRHFIEYLWGLLGAVLDDYALMTLAIFAVLLGFVTSVFIAGAAFFGGYFLVRLTNTIAEGIGYHARTTAQATAQSNMQIAAALARLNPPHDAQESTMLETDPRL